MYPEALEEIDSYHGDTPLHLAFQSSSWFEVISLVIEEYPQAIKKANRMEHTPLHVACICKAQPKPIALLLKKCPEAIKATTNDGNSPLHLACYSDLSLRAALSLLEKYPAAVNQKNKIGKTPIDIVDYEDPSSPVLEYMFQIDALLNGKVENTIALNILNSFAVFHWFGGIDMMFSVGPACMQQILIKIPNEVIPSLLSFLGHGCKMLTLWKILHDRQDLLCG